jgi:hypothetical protein
VAGLHFDADLPQRRHAVQAPVVERRRPRAVRQQRHHRRVLAGTDPPHVQVGDARLVLVQAFADLSLQRRRRQSVEQHRAPVSRGRRRGQRAACTCRR